MTSFLFIKDSLMRTIKCHECGSEVAEDDFIMQECPVCGGFMQPTRLDKKVDAEISAIIRVTSVVRPTLVD